MIEPKISKSLLPSCFDNINLFLIVVIVTLAYGSPQLGNSSSNLNFLVLGDWGGLPLSPYRTNIEKSVASGMNVVAKERNTKFQVALGDNFYFMGVRDVYDKRFQVKYNF